MHGTRSYSWLALSLFAACGDNPPPEGADASSTIDTTGDPTSPPDQSCDSGIYIGRLAPGDTCADHGTWHATPLGSTGLLAEFCEYTWSGDDPPDLTVLPGEADGVFGLAESCPRVIPQGDTTAAEAALRASVYDAYMTNVGRIELAALMGRPTIDPPWLTFVDTIPAGLIPSGKTANDIHGEVLQDLAAALLCGDAAPCPVRLQQSLGLPRLDLRREDHELGGHFGSPADLARGVDAAVRDWETHSHTRLILALAVGWEPVGAYGPDLTGTTLDELLVPGAAPADLQAVLAALMRAACQDAWIVAAVGNATSEPCAQTGAVGPAMLQALASPTPAQCEDARFPHTPDLDPALPFVLSAGHVDLDGGAPGNARTAAPAALTAQGTAFPSRTGGEPSFTGSSLATTGVAAALAAVSTIYPELSRAAVLDSLRVDAPTGVNICRAVRRACEEHAVHSDTACPVCPDEAATAATSVSVAIDDVLAAGASLQLGAVYSSNAPLGDNACGTATTLWPDIGDLPPPEPLDSWTTPMPKGPVCESCQIKIQDPPEKITVGLKLVGLTAAPYPLIIEVVTATGVERYALDPMKLAAGLNTIDIFPALPWSEIQQVRLQVPVRGLDGRWYMRSEPLLPAPPRANPEPPDETTGDDSTTPTGDETGETTEASTSETPDTDTSTDDTSSTTEDQTESTAGDTTDDTAIGQTTDVPELNCQAPMTQPSCDTTEDDVFKAIGLNCSNDKSMAIPISNSIIDSPDGAAYRVATHFGTAMDPADPTRYMWGPREGERFLIIGTGRFPALQADGGVVEPDSSDSEDNDNPDEQTELPGIMKKAEGSNNGSGGTPFMDCDSIGDCSDTIETQWDLSPDNQAHDVFYMSFDLETPLGTHGYLFDFAYFSEEYAEDNNSPSNDMLVVWSTSETFTGNVTFINDQPLTVSALADVMSVPVGSPLLAGTGFPGDEEGAGTGWFEAKGSAAPGETFTIAITVFDMDNKLGDTVGIIDSFRWDCIGCFPSETVSCGIQPQ